MVNPPFMTRKMDQGKYGFNVEDGNLTASR